MEGDKQGANDTTVGNIRGIDYDERCLLSSWRRSTFGWRTEIALLIESNDENKVRAAVEEIRRNLVEASVLALNVSHNLAGYV